MKKSLKKGHVIYKDNQKVQVHAFRICVSTNFELEQKREYNCFPGSMHVVPDMNFWLYLILTYRYSLSFIDILTLTIRILGYLRINSRTSIYLAISGAIGTKLLTIYKRNCLEQTKFAGVQNCLVHKLL